MTRLKRREELEGVERVVSDVLDDYNVRKHGIESSHSGYDVFLWLLANEGYVVAPKEVVERAEIQSLIHNGIYEAANHRLRKLVEANG